MAGRAHRRTTTIIDRTGGLDKSGMFVGFNDSGMFENNNDNGLFIDYRNSDLFSRIEDLQDASSDTRPVSGDELYKHH